MTRKAKIYILGYSIDSCIFGRELANNGYNVIHISTGPLGYPYDNIGECITEDSAKMLSKVAGKKYPFEKLINSTYAYVPYEQLTFSNSRNGLLSYPINKLSFETAEDIDEVALCALSKESFMKKLAGTNNYINLYKSYFPKWLYDNVLKYMSVNKWGGLRQSKLTKRTLLKEIAIEQLDKIGSGVIYRPEISYEEICNDLLDHENITRDSAKMKQVASMIKGRFTDGEVYIMDNRVDMLVGYHNGVFDRVNVTAESNMEQGVEECLDVDNGIVFTPMADTWCTTNKYGIITKIKSEFVLKPYDFRPSVLCPTVNNVKMIEEYEKLLQLYSNKKINLKSYVSTIIM